MPSNDTVVKIFTHPENDLDGEFYVHVRYDMDLITNSNAYAEADLEGACGACAPPPSLKFAKHMLYNVN